MIELYKNIDLVQIKIAAGVDEFAFPKNVDWATKKIDKILLCAPKNACVSPIDGISNVLTLSDVSDLYFDLYDSADHEITYEAHYTNFLYTNNHPLRVDAVLNTQLSKLRFTTPPANDGVLLLYIYWGSEIKKDEDYEAPHRSKTIEVTLAAHEKKTFAELANFIHADGKAVRGIQFWGAENAPAYITLRDYSLDHVFNNLHCVLAKPDMAGQYADDSTLFPMRFSPVDIDMDYSFIRNATASANTQIITFEY